MEGYSIGKLYSKSKPEELPVSLDDLAAEVHILRSMVTDQSPVQIETG